MHFYGTHWINELLEERDAANESEGVSESGITGAGVRVGVGFGAETEAEEW